mmetsp:Transcript_107289/g.346183  ORF Transcript_107289/g.346183 Transcript_107289/m.346183 type:complete len:237 (-) Transcript_107289:2137-2847(-)
MAAEVREDLEGVLNGAIIQARAHEARPHLRIRRETEAAWKRLNGLEGLVEVLAPAPHLHQDAEGEVGGNDLVPLHVCQEFVRQVHAAVACAAVKDGVVDDGVARHVVLLHAVEDLEGLVEVTLYTIALDDRGVRDDVWLTAVRFHRLDQLGNRVHVANTGLRVNHGVVGHGVHLHTLLAHLPPIAHRTVGLVSVRKALDDCGIDHRVGRHLALPLPKELHSVLDATVAHQGVQHAA